MAKSKSEEWLSVVEAAKRLRVTRETIYQAIKDGRLKARVRTVTRKLLRVDPKSLADFSLSVSHQKRGRRGARQRYHGDK